MMTVVEGLSKDVDIKDLAKKLKSKLACGGTAKNGIIELQGTHIAKVKEELIAQGFSEESITVEKPRFKGKRR
jgi:translation initiation factor 1